MRKINKTLTCAIAFLLAASSFVLCAHEDEDGRLEAIYPFHERIHDLCSGHGLMHLDSAQLEALFNGFAGYEQEIAALQNEAPSDNYLVQLTNLIQRSNYTSRQKKSSYRLSYDKCMERLESGTEWSRTLRFLMDSTDVLTRDEIKAHLDSGDVALRAAAERSLLRIKREVEPKGRDGRDASSGNGSGGTAFSAQKHDGDRSHHVPSWVPFALAGGFVILAIVVLVFKLRATDV